MIPPLVQVTKEEKLKELQHHVNKVCTRHQRRSEQLEKPQGVAEKLVLKAMEEITKTKENLNKVHQMSEDNPT